MPLAAVQPEAYVELLRAKSAHVVQLLSPFSPPPPEIFRSPVTGFRMRVEFRMWHEGEALNYAMFDPDQPRIPVPVETMPIADAQIQAIMPLLLAQLRRSPTLRRKLFQTEFLATSTGDILVTLVYHRPLDANWELEAASLRKALHTDFPQLSLIGRSRKQKIVLGRDYARELLEIEGMRYRYRQYEQAFSQPNVCVNRHMITWTCVQAAKISAGDLLELYCGNGNFTLPLARHFHSVIATEVSKASMRAARENLAENAIGNVHLVRLSAQEVAQALAGERVFRRLASLPKPIGDFNLRSLFVDPPRAGLDENTVATAAQFENIIYISCNPVSLAMNLRSLRQTHCITALALFDQFPYTDHMECGVVLRRTRDV
tara:strand:- start:4416 stop:5537 length:1122 start_codon:yes stop_codon:yes gene_type:complete